MCTATCICVYIFYINGKLLKHHHRTTVTRSFIRSFFRSHACLLARTQCRECCGKSGNAHHPPPPPAPKRCIESRQRRLTANVFDVKVIWFHSHSKVACDWTWFLRNFSVNAAVVWVHSSGEKYRVYPQVECFGDRYETNSPLAGQPQFNFKSQRRKFLKQQFDLPIVFH